MEVKEALAILEIKQRHVKNVRIEKGEIYIYFWAYSLAYEYYKTAFNNFGEYRHRVGIDGVNVYIQFPIVDAITLKIE